MKKNSKNTISNVEAWQKVVSRKITEIEDCLVLANKNLEELQRLLGIKCEH